MTPRPRRGDQVPPPPEPGEWDLRYATKESLAFAELERQLAGTCQKARARLKLSPDVRSDVQKPLAGSLATRSIGGVDMPQWQYDLSSGARLWYCVDQAERIVWFTLAAAGHPRATAARGKRSPRNR